MNDKEFVEIAKSICFGGVKEYSEHSTVPLKEQDKMRKKDPKALLQPRHTDGEINPAFIQEYGVKGIALDNDDVKSVEKQLKKGIYDKKKIREDIYDTNKT